MLDFPLPKRVPPPGPAAAGEDGGERLPEDVRAEMEHGFGADFSSVRVHHDPMPRGTLGTAAPEAVNLGPVSAGTPAARRLLAHELAHVVQLRQAGVPDQQATLEADAARAAQDVAAGGRAHVAGAATAGMALRSQLSDLVRTAATKGEVFDALRAAGAADRADPTVLHEARHRFIGQPDDLWLAETLVRSGAEPLWSLADMRERQRRAAAGHWAPEAGNIAAGLEDPNPDAAPHRRIPPVTAYFFPGTDANRRALIIGGVHGSEPEGREVVERLRTRLARESAAGRPPLFTTILVPELIAATHHAYGGPRDLGARNVRVGRGEARAGGGRVEPNRNFPFPGETYAQARARGAGGGAELQTLPIDPRGNPIRSATPRAPRDTARFTTSSQRMLPETRVLLALLERFKPERIVSVHAHGLGTTVGDAPGVFVDPRGTDPRTGAATDPAANAADQALTQSLLAHSSAATPAAQRGAAFAGNAPRAGSTTPNVLYTSSVHGEGNSLGMYGPVATAARPAATTITVEVPEFGSTAQLDPVVDAHTAAIDDVILR